MKRVIYVRMVTFRATEEINDLLEKLSEELKLSKSEVIRRAIVRLAQDYGIHEERVRYVYVSKPGRGRSKEYKDADLVIL